MGDPYKHKRMRITVTEGVADYVLGVVEVFDHEVGREGGVTPYYDSETGKHAVGTKRCTFRMRRWFKADSGNTDLLYALMNEERHFMLKSEISAVAGSSLTLSDCFIYSYRTSSGGGANDIIAEEARGEAVDWIGDIT